MRRSSVSTLGLRAFTPSMRGVCITRYGSTSPLTAATTSANDTQASAQVPRTRNECGASPTLELPVEESAAAAEREHGGDREQCRTHGGRGAELETARTLG